MSVEALIWFLIAICIFTTATTILNIIILRKVIKSSHLLPLIKQIGELEHEVLILKGD